MTEKEGLEIALKKIEECKKKKSTILTLSELSLTAIPPEVNDCIWLKTLVLSYNRINKIERLGSLKTLVDLYLYGNEIAKIEGLDGLINLKKLSLFSNKIEKIEGLNKLIKLESLDLSMNRIKEIEWKNLKPLLNNLSNLKALSLYRNPIADIPAEMLADKVTKFGDSCLNELVQWFKELEKGSSSNYQLKLMLLGNGAAGKSSLVEALKKGKCKIECSSTHGVVIDVLDLYTDDELRFYCWDFGGQEIYHGTHRLFLSSKSIQVIIFDPEFEKLTTTPDRITGEEQRNLKVEFWHRYVKETSPESKIIIVQNKLDLHKERYKPVEQYALENNIPFIHLSAKEGINIDDIIFRLKKIAHNFSEYGMLMPKSWLKMREYFFDNMAKDIPTKTMSLQHFQLLCKEYKISKESFSILLYYLNDTGIIYYNEKYLSDTIIIDQRWALKAIYTLFDRSGKFYDALRNEMQGKCRIKYLFMELGDNYTREQKELILDFMQACSLCFLIRNESKEELNDEMWCVIPEFLSPKIPRSVEFLKESQKNNLMCLTKKHTFLHYHTIQQFISLVSSKTDLSLIWRNGIAVNIPNSSFIVLGDFDSNTIHLFIDQNANIELIKDIIFKIEGSSKENLKGWENADDDSFILFEKEIAGSLKETQQEKGDKKPSLDDFPPKLQIKPKEVIFSYAKEDIDTLKLIRNHLGGLEHDNLISIWYDKELSNTRDWDKEIKSHFESCDAVIIIGSSDYISPDKKYIWKQEIPLIMKRFETSKVYAVRINASYHFSPGIINSINCFDKENPIPVTKRSKDKFISRFVNEEISNKLLKEFKKH